MSKEQSCIVKAWEATVRKSQAAAKRRAHSIFTTMSVAHADDDDSLPGDVYHAEKVLSNGDFYTGQWSDNLPHGHGKYLWTDGCMYVGEWVKGKTNGKGRFSWPSGATYEGEFKSGYMDGKGTYTGASGDTYKGSWVMNLKQGQGTKCYANGDYYDGEWEQGSQEGAGRYQWKNGNHYIGQWRKGVINGNGTMIWANGNRYDGCWEEGLPRGNGTFRWAEGSFYVGNWSKDPKEQTGTYYPSDSPAGRSEWNHQELFTGELSDCKINPGENVSVVPLQRMLNWPGLEGEFLQKQAIWKYPAAEEEKKEKKEKEEKEVKKQGSIRPRRMSVDGKVNYHGWDGDGDVSFDIIDGNSVLVEDGDEGLGSLQLEDPDLTAATIQQQHITLHPMKKQGETISKGHKNYELMLNLQLGIRHSVGRPAPATSLDLRSSAFDPKEKVWTKFPPEGSKHTPPHQSSDFRWKDYCPLVFRTLRKLFKVDPADYMISICGNDALRELSSPGKSGSFFYLTNDDRYMIKTMKKSEVKVLLRMLPAYYNHVRSFEDTLVTKFYGLHCVKLTGTAQKKVRFVIMGNLFCTEYFIHRRFDLKGSSHGRTTDKPEAEIDATTTLKDLDLNYIFRLQKAWYQDFCRQVDKDCDLLEQERIMDYSLLIGLHFREAPGFRNPTGNRTPTGVRTPTGNGDPDNGGATPRLSGVDMDQLLLDRRSSIRLGINMPARVEKTVRKGDETQLIGEPTGELYEVVLFFGIIDILQDYDISKKLEHAYKSIQFDPTSISAVDPKQYSKRFRDFIFRAFTEDT